MSIFLQFLRSLCRCLDQHLHLTTHPRRGTRELRITPWDRHTLMKIRLVLSWVEGHRVMYLGDAQINLLFKTYCDEYFSNHYNLREQGYKIIWNKVPK